MPIKKFESAFKYSIFINGDFNFWKEHKFELLKKIPQFSVVQNQMFEQFEFFKFFFKFYYFIVVK